MITVRLIQDLVCEKFKISRDQLLDDDRHIKFAHPRQVAMILAREMTGMSLPALGMAFCRDHTTILYAIRKRNKIEAIPRYAQGMAEIHAELMAPAEAASRLAELKMRKAWKAAIPSHMRREAA